MTETIHTARSPEFLSRLYDGEVGAAERAAFEAHRSGCEECRIASEAFAATLAAFRSSPTAPPPADLSARILRKIRAQSPSRRPFAVMFGIDVRWAGVFVAALLVVLMAAPLLLRRQGPAPAAPSAIPARILDATATTAQPNEAPGNALSSPAEREAKAAAPAPRREVRSLESPPVGSAAGNAADASPSSPGLSVRPVDGEGPPPRVASRPDDTRLAPLRGQEFLVVVEVDGHVSKIDPLAGKDRPSKAEAPAMAEKRSPSLPDALLALRFSPGERPRRLLVRVE